VAFQISRRKFLGYGAAVVTCSAVAADTFFFAPHHPVTEHIEIRLDRLPPSFNGFRIAQISDIHFGPYMGKAGVERGVLLAQQFNPDLVVLTGDFVSHPFGKPNGPEGARHAEPVAEIFHRWQGVPIVGILGNHDHWNDPKIVAGALRSGGIRVLLNESYAIEREQDRLWIAGLDDAFENKADLIKAIASVPKTEATIVLVHEPDVADNIARAPVDLQLSGHSHGGQVQIPGVGPIVLPYLGKKYPIGLYRIGQMQLYTSRGLGVINPPVRFDCPPEVTLITLRASRALA